MSLITADHVHVLATNETDAHRMEQEVQAAGGRVSRTTIWKGVVPEGSYMPIDEYTRMSTPEFFFLRKANEYPHDLAVTIGNELCGYYATQITVPSLPDWYWESIPEQRTTKAKLTAYLQQCPNAPECQHALQILDEVEDGRMMP